MELIDCEKIRDTMLDEAISKISKINDTLTLAIIQVEGDNASNVYVRNKIKTCKKVGIECKHIKLPNDVSFEELSEIIKTVNDDKNVTAVMLQLPVPEHLKPYEQELLDLIDWTRDVDGLSTESVGRLWNDKECITPATATGILRLLPNDLTGQYVIVAGRSKLVGKPLIKLLQDRNATVNTIHSKTNILEIDLENCNIFISAIGKPKYWNNAYFWNGNYQYMVKCDLFIDVGVNKDLMTNRLCGDIDIDTFKGEACAITPVPRGVGVITCVQLMLNVVKCYELQQLNK